MKTDHQQKIRSILGQLGIGSAYIQLNESMNAPVNEEAFLFHEKKESIHCIVESLPES